MKKIKRALAISVISCSAVFSLYGCSILSGNVSDNTDMETIDGTDEEVSPDTQQFSEPAKITGLIFDHEVPIEKSDFLKIDAYKDGYYVIKSGIGKNLQQLLVIPEGQKIPEGLSEDILILQQPVISSKIDSITMAELLCEINDNISEKLTLVSLEKDKIYIDDIVANMDNGITKYAGKTTEPNIDLIKQSGCQVYLCKPDLKKSDAYKDLQGAGITPFMTYLHNETDIWGRIEWVKALGVIYGDLKSAESFYDSQKKLAQDIDRSKAENKTYAMVCLNKKKNKAYVRRTSDPFAKIGELAGGVNMMTDNPKGFWQEMSIDDFVSNYKDTDYLIYFDKHGDEVTSVKQLTDISDKLADFKSVKEGNVWRTRTDYLQMNKVGNMAIELNGIFADDEETVTNSTEFVRIE